jgi:hypothetical protein
MSESIYFVDSEFGTMLGEVIAEDVQAKVIKAWKPEYGELIDFGGGVKDVTCKALVQLCEGKPSKLTSLFPVIKLAEAKAILAICKESSKSDF